MKMPMYHDRSSRHVGFAPELVYSRCPREDEKYVMKEFHRHAIKCRQCNDPYATHLDGGTLCDRGHSLARDIARYIYSKRGRAYSIIDRESQSQRVQVEIPPKCSKVRELLEAVDHGLRVRRSRPVVSHDKNYYVRPRPDKRSYYVDRYGVPVSESRGHVNEDHRNHGYRRYGYDVKQRHRYEDRYQYPEKRQSTPTTHAHYGSLWEKDAKERQHLHSYYDGNPVYYYSKNGEEKRIPRSESPTRESLGRKLAEDYSSAKYGFSGSRRPSSYDHQDKYRSSRYHSSNSYPSSRYHSPDSYPSSRQHSPDSYPSSRHASSDSYRSSRQASPAEYSSKRSFWSPGRLYRDYIQ